MKYSIGLDLGGTKINAALIRRDKILKQVKIPTENNKGKRHVVNRITASLKEVIKGTKKRDITGIGIGSPGPLDMEKGRILKTPNLTALRNFILRGYIHSKFKLKTYITNDVNAMALGENVYGAGKKYTEIVCLTIGTGLGGAVIVNDEIYYGKGNAGEIGHMIIMENGYRCGCGRKGCFEAYVSSKGVARESKKIFRKALLPLDIENMARKGNKKAKEVYRRTGVHLGVGMASITSILDPQAIIIGGGIAHAGKILFNSAIKELKKRSINKPPKVIGAKLGKNAGVIGAAHLPILGGKSKWVN